MSALTRALGVVVLCCATYIVVSAQTVAHPNLHEYVSSVEARSAIVMHADSDEVIWSQNADVTHPIASLTKLMTAAVVANSEVDREQMVDITASDVRRASTTYLRLHDRVSVESLLYLMMVGSDNAAARALARTVSSPTAFVRSMNALAQELHLTQSVFDEPSGLSAENRASAHDVAKLVRYTAARSQSVLMNLLNTPIYQTRIGTRTVVVSNTNRFLTNQTVVSKTGYTSAAKYCLTLMIEGRNGERYIVVVLGAPTSQERFAIGELFQRLLTETPDPLAERTAVCGPMPDTISDAGKAFIRAHEHMQTTAYYDKVGYAIGYGMHTWRGRTVTRRYPGRVTLAEVEDEFDRQLHTHVKIVKTHVCAPLTQPMLDSLVSVTWNLGRVNTSILKKFDRNRPIVARDFLTTATVHRRPYPSLINRRLREYLMFSGDYDAAMDTNTLRGLRQLTHGTQVVMGS